MPSEFDLCVAAMVRIMLLLQTSDWIRELESWRQRLEYQIFQAVAHMRLGHMFDIVVAYPESQAAVEDVGVCLGRTNLHAVFVSSFRRAIRHRLLHAGTCPVRSGR